MWCSYFLNLLLKIVNREWLNANYFVYLQRKRENACLAFYISTHRLMLVLWR